MRIGVPRETKVHEYRVGLMLASVAELVHHGHEVCIEAGAGTVIDFSDEHYVDTGASIAGTAAEVFAYGELVV